MSTGAVCQGTAPKPHHARRPRMSGFPEHRARRPTQMVQWPTPLSQGHYLGISEENTMVPGIGRAPRKGNHSGSPEVVPADPCE